MTGPYPLLTEAFHADPTFGHSAVDDAQHCYHCRDIVAALFPADQAGDCPCPSLFRDVAYCPDCPAGKAGVERG